MQIQFNYRYYLNSEEYEVYHLELQEYKAKQVARNLDEVEEVVHFAQYMQERGNYVALYLSYEAAKAFNHTMAVVIPKRDSNCFAVAYVFAKALNVNTGVEISEFKPQQQFTFELKDETLVEHIKEIQRAIKEGNTYQVNYTTRLTDRIRQPISTLFSKLIHRGHGNYAALFDTEEVQVASFSPELFFQYGTYNDQPKSIVSKPMKGTRPRLDDAEADRLNYMELSSSSKDRAENVMIVDLLRNDISRISQTGSVQVYNLFNVERYETVYQMTSMVTGRVQDGIGLIDVLKALFPCGSITGAPKHNTMQYISKLERTPRHIYCGTLGLLLPSGNSIFNVPIRTVEYIDNEAIYGVGAGITIDSDPKAEVQEFKDKMKILEYL
ncbi:anthranilate synthase component I family protein [Staphylococcus sp. SQ8-PEA]|uniref:Anthranilate synthase component I family protein n=1 Tax=Staphylococcus marylandisciuri TaxID=2981529 RepID=A0ABT2QP96_9STAP|nr:anthranilate synthase component I family protein [Staphylococcus marylandisciuri]MCU5745801.1 anthranilate synthase component I family protein [Staphylococcus marylandisciuri]